MENPLASNTEVAVNSDKPAVPRRFTIKVLGVGGAGCNAVNYLARGSFDGITFAALNTDSQALAQAAVSETLVLGAHSMRGIGAGGDPDRGRAAAEEDLEQISALCGETDLVLLVAGLGGGTGTGASPVIARAAKEKGALVLAIVFLPFDFEGVLRQEKAELGRRELQAVADGLICLPNQKIFKLVDENTSVLEAFGIANEFVAQGLRGIWRLLTRPGLINVDFADLCAATQGKHAESVLVTAEAQGENRARELTEKLFAHPLMQGGQSLNDASSLLVSIVGGPDLTMVEINRVMEQIHRQAEHAHIIMGATIEADWKERLAVTLVASGGQSPQGNVLEAEDNGQSGSEPIKPAPARRRSPSSPEDAPELRGQNESEPAPAHASSRFVGPPPSLTPERRNELLNQQSGVGGRQRKSANRMRQGQLPLEIISKGRFEKSAPTIHQGQDLDVPTYIRRGVALN